MSENSQVEQDNPTIDTMQVNIRLTKDQYYLLRKTAFEENTTRSEIVREALDKFFALRKSPKDIKEREVFPRKMEVLEL